MKSYIASWKYVIVHLLLVILFSPIIIIGHLSGVYVWYGYLALIPMVVIAPLSIASLLNELFVFDMLLEDSIEKEICAFKNVQYFMAIMFMFLYIVGVIMVINGEEPLVFYNAYIFMIFPLIQQRVVLTKDRLYTRFWHINRSEILEVEKIGKGRYNIKHISGKAYSIMTNDNVGLFNDLM